MTHLTTFKKDSNVAVVGAAGGIGSALCHALGADTAVGTVHAFSRAAMTFADTRVSCYPLDITDEKSIKKAAEQCTREAPLDLVIVATGILHRDGLRPEKTMTEIDQEIMLEVFRINAVAPALVAKHFLPRMSREDKTVFAALSARVGSIADNRLGGWTSYRASKAALNMTLKTLSIEHGRRWPEAVVVALHPGTVDTALSKPYNSRVPAEKLFAPKEAAEHLLNVIDGLVPEDSGGFFAWNGQDIPF